MTGGVLMDTGPLAAYYLPRERHHGWAVEQFGKIEGSLLTCEPVLTEVCHFLARANVPARELLRKVEDGTIELAMRLEDEASAVSELMTRYGDRPMSLADACLVRMAEITDLPICTIDSDFHVYRKNRRHSLSIICP